MKEGVVRAVDALQSPWLIGAFFLLLVLLAWCNVSNPVRLRSLLRTSVLLRLPKQSFREDVDVFDRFILILFIVAVLSLSVFLYQIGVLSGRLVPEQTTLLRIVGIVVLLMASSLFLVRALGWSFNASNDVSPYLYHAILQLILLGLLLLPVSLMLTFAPLPRDVLVVIGAVLIGLVILLRWLRGLSLGISAGIPVVYIVLYLCAAEILPALIGLRMLGISPIT